MTRKNHQISRGSLGIRDYDYPKFCQVTYEYIWIYTSGSWITNVKNHIQRSLKPPSFFPGKPQTDFFHIFHLPSLQFPTQLAIRESIERQGKGLPVSLKFPMVGEISHKTAGFTGVQNIYSRWFIFGPFTNLPFGIGKPSILTLRYRVSPYPKTSFFSDRLLFGVRKLS